MNYQKIYDRLIEKARFRVEIDGYFEVHHIVPKSLGGSNHSSNLVKLTAREHFIAHCLLARIHGGTQWATVVYFKGNKQSYFNSKLYEHAKKNHSIEISKVMMGRTNTKGYKHSDEFKAAISIRMKNNKNSLGKKPGTSAALKGRKRPDLIGNTFAKAANRIKLKES